MAREIIEHTSEDDELWLTVKIKNQLFAIDSKYVQTIFQLQEEPTKIPHSGPSIAGIIKMRKDIITLIDLRVLLGMETLDHEEKIFGEMLEQRKHDHIHWVEELKRSIDEAVPFTLATDPHKCAFGKWYDTYQSTDPQITFLLKKIDEPHQLLHKTAVDVVACQKQKTEEEVNVCVNVNLKKASEEYMPQVVGLLEEAKKMFRENCRRMCVVILYEGALKGIMVDAVDTVEKMTVISNAADMYANGENSMVSSVAQRASGQEQILMLDIPKIMAAI